MKLEEAHDVDALLAMPTNGTGRLIYWLLLRGDAWEEPIVVGLYENESRPTALALESSFMYVAPVVLDEHRGKAEWPGMYRPAVEQRPAREIEEVYYWRTTLGIAVDERIPLEGK